MGYNKVIEMEKLMVVFYYPGVVFYPEAGIKNNDFFGNFDNFFHNLAKILYNSPKIYHATML